MRLRIRFQAGPRAGEVLEFDETVQRVVLGRDPARCQVLFERDDTRVGRQHCALEHALGRYRLVLNETNEVLVDGGPVLDQEELRLPAELQLGPDGPRVLLEQVRDDDLPSTIRGDQESPAEAVRRLTRSSRDVRRLALVALAAVAVLAGGVYVVARWLAGEVRLIEAELRPDDARLAARAPALGEKAERLSGTARTPGLTELEPRVRAALYRVVRRDDLGGEAAVGTAWVVGEGTLATNAHVAETVHDTWSHDTFHVVPEGEGLAEARVASSEIHPGFRQFKELIVAHQPIVQGLLAEFRELDVVVPCDVALLHVDPEVALGSPLSVAGADVLRALSPGDVLGTAGYLVENVPHGRVPVAPWRTGAIVALTDPLLARGAVEDRILVHHDVPATGGVSGSPMVNEAGRVVALLSGGTVFAVGGRRQPSAALFNHAQRADVLAELLAGPDVVRARQAERLDRWRRLLAAFPSALSSSFRLHAAHASWSASLEPDDRTELLTQHDGRLSDDGRAVPSAAFRVTLPRAGSHLVLAVSPPPGDDGVASGDEQELDLAVFGEGDELLGEDEDLGAVASVSFMTWTPGQPVEILVTGVDDGAPFALRVHGVAEGSTGEGT